MAPYGRPISVMARWPLDAKNDQKVSGWWLGHPSEKYERQLG